MSLAEILARKKLKQEPPKITEVPPWEDSIPYLSNSKYLPLTYDKTFFSIYSVLISNPYQSITAFRTFASFILADNIYVLNTFSRLNIDEIFSLYMKLNPPTKPTHLYSLSLTLYELHLNVPLLYQDNIKELIIQKSKNLQNW